MKEIDSTTFALTMLIVGMGGTLLVLAGMIGIIELLKKIFPIQETPKE